MIFFIKVYPLGDWFYGWSDFLSRIWVRRDGTTGSYQDIIAPPYRLDGHQFNTYRSCVRVIKKLYPDAKIKYIGPPELKFKKARFTHWL